MDGEAPIQTVITLAPGSSRRDKVNRPAVLVPVEGLRALAATLQSDERLRFDMLLDHMAIDWIADGRFELVYHFYSTIHGHHLIVTTLVPRDKPVAPTLGDLWPIAHWQEREVFDLMGVLYDGHADLRRLFLEDDWEGYPLRKDYKDDSMLELPK